MEKTKMILDIKSKTDDDSMTDFMLGMVDTYLSGHLGYTMNPAWTYTWDDFTSYCMEWLHLYIAYKDLEEVIA